MLTEPLIIKRRQLQLPAHTASKMRHSCRRVGTRFSHCNCRPYQTAKRNFVPTTRVIYGAPCFNTARRYEFQVITGAAPIPTAKRLQHNAVTST